MIFVVLKLFLSFLTERRIKNFLTQNYVRVPPLRFFSKMVFGQYLTNGKSDHQNSKRFEFSSSKYTKLISHSSYHISLSKDKRRKLFWQLWWRFIPGSWVFRLEMFTPLNSTRRNDLNRYLDQHTTLSNHTVKNACKRIGKLT